MRLCMGSRRGFICRMKVGNLQTTGDMAAAHGLHRMKQRNSLGPPARDGQTYAVVHCTGYIKNWPPTGEFDRDSHSCFMAELSRENRAQDRTSTTCRHYHRIVTSNGLSRSLFFLSSRSTHSESPELSILKRGRRRARGIRTNRSWNTTERVCHVCTVN